MESRAAGASVGGCPVLTGGTGWTAVLDEGGAGWPDPACVLDSDVTGGGLPEPVRAWTALDGGDVIMAAAGAWAPVVAEDAVVGPDGFASGLWRGDVVEWFWTDPGTGAYVEWNLAPSGAWWCGVFRSPREPGETGPSAEAGRVSFRVRVRAFGAGDVVPGALEWRAVLRARAAAIEASIGGCRIESARLNVAAIRRVGAERRFVSWCRLGGTQPDFHRPSEFAAVSLRPAVFA